MRRFPLWIAVWLLAGCSYFVPTLVINHRDTVVELEYSGEPTVHADGIVTCQLEEVPKIAPIATLGRQPDIRKLQLTEFVRVPGTCEFRVKLPARHFVYFARNSVCSNNWRTAAESLKPQLIFLRVTGDSGSLEWRGWEVSKALEKHGRASTAGYCAIHLT